MTMQDRPKPAALRRRPPEGIHASGNAEFPGDEACPEPSAYPRHGMRHDVRPCIRHCIRNYIRNYIQKYGWQ